MSTFITPADYNTAIHPDLLARVTGGDTAIVDDAEETAIEFMRGYLAARYDIDAIFSAIDSDRNPILVKYGVDITLAYLYNRISPDAIPKVRSDNYEAAERWLRRVQKEEINPPDLPKVVDGSKDYVIHGSNPQRTNHIR